MRINYFIFIFTKNNKKMENNLSKIPIDRIKCILNDLVEITNNSTNNLKRKLEEHFKTVDTNAIVWNWNDYTNEEEFVKRWSEFLFNKISITQEKDISFNLIDFLWIIDSLARNLNSQTFQSDFYKFALYEVVDNIQCYSYQFSQFFRTKFELLEKEKVKYTFKDFLVELLKTSFAEIDSFLEDLVYLLGNDENQDSLSLITLKNNIEDIKADILGSIGKIFILLNDSVTQVEGIISSALAALEVKKINNAKYKGAISYMTTQTRLNNITRKLVDGFYRKLILNYNSSIRANELFMNEEDFTMNKEPFDTETDALIFAEQVYFKNVPIFKTVNIKNRYSDIIVSLIENKEFKTTFESILLSKPVLEFFEHEQSEYFKNEKFEKAYYFAQNNIALLWEAIKLIPMPENIGGATTDMLRIFINTVPKKFYNCNVNNSEDEIERKVK
jgi:hypothetical protein